mgnify:CR=1 FL=1
MDGKLSIVQSVSVCQKKKSIPFKKNETDLRESLLSFQSNHHKPRILVLNKADSLVCVINYLLASV